jgi:hypothetical protein
MYMDEKKFEKYLTQLNKHDKIQISQNSEKTRQILIQLKKFAQSVSKSGDNTWLTK